MPLINWFILFTRSNQEQRVVENLTKRKVECYCPNNKVFSVSGIRRKVIHKPLFTSFVFVRFPAMRLEELRKIDGVASLVYWLDKPAVVRDIEIEMMRRFLEEHNNIQLEKNIVNVNDIVKITNETLSEKEGSEIAEAIKVVKLVLPSLGYSLVAEVKTESVEVIVKTDPVRFDSSSMENRVDIGVQ